MDQSPSSSWRAMLERGRQERPLREQSGARPSASPAFGYDDGRDPVRQDSTPMAPQDVADEAAMALADVQRDYRPWILQRGPRPVMMLNLRRFDARSGLWTGWALGYPSLAAIEYTGAELVSLDFGARQFMLEGRGLAELIDHLQSGTVLCVQEFSPSVWSVPPPNPVVLRIRAVGQTHEAQPS